jgi:hypothetical protein
MILQAFLNQFSNLASAFNAHVRTQAQKNRQLSSPIIVDRPAFQASGDSRPADSSSGISGLISQLEFA